MRDVLWVKPLPSDTPTDIEGPTPERAGLSTELWYRVLDIHDNGNIESEAYFSVINEEGEVWFLSNRHFIVMDVENNQGQSVAFIKSPAHNY